MSSPACVMYMYGDVYGVLAIVRRTPFDFPLWKEACTPVSPTEFISSLSGRRPADTRAFNLPVTLTFNIHGGILQFQISITFATSR